MANETLTPTIIAKRALMNLDNNLVMGNLVYRDYESEFGPSKIGDTVTIRRPVEFTVTSGATLSLQDVTEGSLTMQVDKHNHTGFSFPTKDLTLTIEEFDKRYIRPAMIALANQIDQDLMALYKDVNNWCGTPGQVINAVTDFMKGPERMDELAVPSSERYGVLSPTDWYGLAGNFSGLFVSQIAGEALRMAKLPEVAGVDLYSAQNAPTHTVGAHGGTPLVDGASQNVTYSSVRTTMTQTLITDGWATSAGLKKGDIFTIAGVFDVNPVTKATLPHLKQFVLTADVTTNASGASDTNLTIYPAIISSGAYQNVSAVPADNAAITYLGTASTGYRQNLLFHKNAFALAMVPFEEAPSGSGVAQKTERYKGLAATYSSQFDITNYKQIYRFDVLYGARTIDPRLATRLSGTA